MAGMVGSIADVMSDRLYFIDQGGGGGGEGGEGWNSVRIDEGDQ
jgi:hypothetical protein